MSRAKPAPSHDQLLKVATSLFATRGFARTTLRAIAEEAGVNQGMIHYYWKTKSALYEAVYRYVFEDFSRMVNESSLGINELNLDTKRGKEKMVKVIIQEAFSLLERQPHIALIISRHMLGDAPETEHLTEKYARPLFELANTIFKEQMDKGRIREQNLKITIAAFCFIYMGFHMGGGPYLFPDEDFINRPESRKRLADHVEYMLSRVLMP